MRKNNIKKGDVVFYTDEHEAWMTNIITDVLKVKGKIATIRTRGYNAQVETKRLTKIPVDKDFPIYMISTYKSKYPSPD